ncbi:MAG TPA: DUF2786 domain-containing protein [Verrucomicrobiae bacterium]|nr:DUF2786 domain-containing protein [Verrucomicrobiae bacterium]
MSEREKIIEKIKKLLRMKHGGTPDEIATALRLAQELGEKHGIDLSDVNPDEQRHTEQPISHEDEVIGARVSWESKYAALVIDQFFKVRVFKSVNAESTKYVMRFVGEEWDIQIATYVYRFLCGHFRREWKSRRGRCRNRQAFMWGMYLGLCQKLYERQPVTDQQPGLVRTERSLARRNEYISQHFGELNSSSAKPDGDAAQARQRGWLAGRATEINSGVKDAAGKTQALPIVQEERLLQ